MTSSELKTVLEELNTKRDFHLKQLADIDIAIAVVQLLEVPASEIALTPIPAKPVKSDGVVLTSVLDVLQKNTVAMTVNKIAGDLDIPVISARNAVYRGVKEGKIDRVGHGVFTLAKVKPPVTEVINKTKTASEKIAEKLGIIPVEVGAEE